MTRLLLCTWNQLNHFIVSDQKAPNTEVHRPLKNCGFSVQNLLYVTILAQHSWSGSWIFGKFVHPCLFLVPVLRMGSATPPVPHILTWHILGQLYLVLPTWSHYKVRELGTLCLPWQHWTKALVWFDDDISAFHSCVVVDLWKSLSEWHLLLSVCVLVCRRENVGAWIRAMNEH